MTGVSIDINLDVVADLVRRELVNQGGVTPTNPPLALWVSAFDLIGKGSQTEVTFGGLAKSSTVASKLTLDFKLVVLVSPGMLSPIDGKDTCTLVGSVAVHVLSDLQMVVSDLEILAEKSTIAVALPSGAVSNHMLSQLLPSMSGVAGYAPPSTTGLAPHDALVRLLLSAALSLIATVTEGFVPAVVDALFKLTGVENLLVIKTLHKAVDPLGPLARGVLAGTPKAFGNGLIATLNSIAGTAALLPQQLGGLEKLEMAVNSIAAQPVVPSSNGAQSRNFAQPPPDLGALDGVVDLTPAQRAAFEQFLAAAVGVQQEVAAKPSSPTQAISYKFNAQWWPTATANVVQLRLTITPFINAAAMVAMQTETQAWWDQFGFAPVSSPGAMLSLTAHEEVISSFASTAIAAALVATDAPVRLARLQIVTLANQPPTLRVIVGLDEKAKLPTTVPPLVSGSPPDVLLDLEFTVAQQDDHGLGFVLVVRGVGVSKFLLEGIGAPDDPQAARTKSVLEQYGNAGEIEYYWIISKNAVTEEFDELIADIGDVASAGPIVAKVLAFSLGALLDVALGVYAGKKASDVATPIVAELKQGVAKLSTIRNATSALFAFLAGPVANRTFTVPWQVGWQQLRAALPKSVSAALATSAAEFGFRVTVDGQFLGLQLQKWPASLPKRKQPLKAPPSFGIAGKVIPLPVGRGEPASAATLNASVVVPLPPNPAKPLTGIDGMLAADFLVQLRAGQLTDIWVPRTVLSLPQSNFAGVSSEYFDWQLLLGPIGSPQYVMQGAATATANRALCLGVGCQAPIATVVSASDFLSAAPESLNLASSAVAKVVAGTMLLPSSKLEMAVAFWSSVLKVQQLDHEQVESVYVAIRKLTGAAQWPAALTKVGAPMQASLQCGWAGKFAYRLLVENIASFALAPAGLSLVLSQVTTAEALKKTIVSANEQLLSSAVQSAHALMVSLPSNAPTIASCRILVDLVLGLSDPLCQAVLNSGTINSGPNAGQSWHGVSEADFSLGVVVAEVDCEVSNPKGDSLKQLLSKGLVEVDGGRKLPARQLALQDGMEDWLPNSGESGGLGFPGGEYGQPNPTTDPELW